MDPSDLPEESIFEGALDCATPEARAAFLDRACAGHPDLRRRVDLLLEAHEEAGDFLDASAAARLSAPSPTRDVDLPSRIGRYRILRQIGEGGMGSVYLAQQTEPVTRTVALKVIKLGMDTREVIARFEAERQALALMDHPNIARVLDAGTVGEPGHDTDAGGTVAPGWIAGITGRPYFVMELVQGVPITEFCEKQHLSIQERLELFIPVCQAVQHAHQKGIIHRDLKPSNVLVSSPDGTRAAACPKVIDFGVAKAIHQNLTDKTLQTRQTQLIGTPAYMSPEQAELSGMDVDTRSDVYSLGVLLYELLTGTTPFDSRELLRAGLDDLRRTIRETEPMKPSTRLAHTPPPQPRHSRGPRAHPAAPSRPVAAAQLQGDLDWIVMKCLEKDRNRRYETANGLAADLRRHLNNEPVSVAAPTFRYQVAKFYKRNRLKVHAAALLVSVLTVATSVSSWQALRARAANARLAESVRSLEMRLAEDRFNSGDASTAMAQLASILSRDPSNHLAANRLVSAWVHRNLALPALPVIHHPAPVTSLAVSPDGSRLLTCSLDGIARIRNTTNGQPVGSPMPHPAPVVRALFSPEGRFIVSASQDGTARVWDGFDGRPLTSPLNLGAPAVCLDLSPNGHFFAAGSSGNGASLWTLPEGLRVARLPTTTTTVTTVAFSPSGTLLATGTDQGRIELWNLDAGRLSHALEGHTDQLTSLQFSSDDRWLLSASYDHTARLWDVASGGLRLAPFTHPDLVHGARFSPDDRLLVTLCENGAAQLWSPATGRPIGPPLLHLGAVRIAAFSADSSLLATGSMDLTARVWDLGSSTAYCQTLWHGEYPRGVAFSPRGDRLFTAAMDRTARVWDVRPRRLNPRIVAHDRRLWAIEVSPDGRMLATASADQTARLWNLHTGEPLGEPLRHDSKVSAVAFSPDSGSLLTGDDQSVQLWNVKTSQPRFAEKPRHAAMLWSLRFSPDGGSFLTGSEDGTARLWDSLTGRPLTPPLQHEGPVVYVEFSPDGQTLATASLDHTARLWQASDGRPHGPPMHHGDEVKSVAFSPDGSSVITASTDNTARIWEVQSGKPKTGPMQHARIVERAFFSPDGRRVVTASIDRTARLWEAATARALTPPLSHNHFVSDARFSPDGSCIISSCLDASARFWDVASGVALSEPLVARTAPSLNHVRFSPDGRRIAAASNGSPQVFIWDFPAAPIPVPAWVPRLTEEILGLRVTPAGNLEMIADPDVSARLREVPIDNPGGYYEHVVAWLLADPEHRSDSPFAGRVHPVRSGP